MSTKTQDADVIFNRVNVALAQSQKLVQSWLSPANNGKEDQEDLWTQKTEGDNDFEIAPESYVATSSEIIEYIINID